MTSSPLPLVYIATSLRSCLRDLTLSSTPRHDMRAVHRVTLEQLYALIAELERHDGTKEREAANDS